MSVPLSAAVESVCAPGQSLRSANKLFIIHSVLFLSFIHSFIHVHIIHSFIYDSFVLFYCFVHSFWPFAQYSISPVYSFVFYNIHLFLLSDFLLISFIITIVHSFRNTILVLLLLGCREKHSFVGSISYTVNENAVFQIHTHCPFILIYLI